MPGVVPGDGNPPLKTCLGHWGVELQSLYPVAVFLQQAMGLLRGGHVMLVHPVGQP